MGQWLADNLISVLLLVGGILHTAMKVGEWIRARESAPTISEADLLKVLAAERDRTRNEVHEALEDCVSADIHRALHDALDRRIETLERIVYKGRPD